jgi:hypothetical protein
MLPLGICRAISIFLLLSYPLVRRSPLWSCFWIFLSHLVVISDQEAYVEVTSVLEADARCWRWLYGAGFGYLGGSIS